MLLLLACDDGKPPGEVAPDQVETGAPEDTGDTATPEAWEPVIPPCDLVAPLPVDPSALPAYDALYGPSVVDFVALGYRIDMYAEEQDCLSMSEPSEGTTVYEGPCDSADLLFLGRWTRWEDTVGAVERARETAEDVQLVDDYAFGLRLSANGFVAWENERPALVIERNVSIDLQNWGSSDGSWYTRSFEAYSADDHTLAEMYVDLGPDAGDACVSRDTQIVPACELEPYGGWVLQAASTVVYRFDPYMSCDGCADVTIDGAEAGQVCGYEYGANYVD